eukprot:scaffold274845_cov17-Prasinocladus_malaysianus.AAC.1
MAVLAPQNKRVVVTPAPFFAEVGKETGQGYRHLDIKPDNCMGPPAPNLDATDLLKLFTMLERIQPLIIILLQAIDHQAEHFLAEQIGHCC